MSNKRNPNVVTAQILDKCSEGAGKTRVIYQANLNATTGKHHLDSLVRSGYIETIPKGSRTIYKTTPKGRELQEKLGEIKTMMELLYSHA